MNFKTKDLTLTSQNGRKKDFTFIPPLLCIDGILRNAFHAKDLKIH
jgi:hypothetical protein